MTSAIAEALSFAHQHGVVHPRSKAHEPVSARRRPAAGQKLLDFGIAWRFGRRRDRRRTGGAETHQVHGAEQARDERPITPAADLFSLGCAVRVPDRRAALCGRPSCWRCWYASCLKIPSPSRCAVVICRHRSARSSIACWKSARAAPGRHGVVRAITCAGEIPDTSACDATAASRFLTPRR